MKAVFVDHFGLRLRLRPPGAHRNGPFWYIDGGSRERRIRQSSGTFDLAKAKRVAFYLASGEPVLQAMRNAELDIRAAREHALARVTPRRTRRRIRVAVEIARSRGEEEIIRRWIKA